MFDSFIDFFMQPLAPAKGSRSKTSMPGEDKLLSGDRKRSSGVEKS